MCISYLYLCTEDPCPNPDPHRKYGRKFHLYHTEKCQTGDSGLQCSSDPVYDITKAVRCLHCKKANNYEPAAVGENPAPSPARVQFPDQLKWSITVTPPRAPPEAAPRAIEAPDPPNTGQVIHVMSWYYSGFGHDSSTGRYNEALKYWVHLLEPLTYETPEAYEARQRQLGRHDDKRIIQGEYWTWFYTRQSYHWLPRRNRVLDRDWLRRRLDGEVCEFLPDNHIWVIGGVLQIPKSWWDHKLLKTSPEIEHRYVIAYSKTPESPTPLPYEGYNAFVERQRSFRNPMKDPELQAIYTRWYTLSVPSGFTRPT